MQQLSDKEAQQLLQYMREKEKESLKKAKIEKSKCQKSES
jgi:hypothetical protein